MEKTKVVKRQIVNRGNSRIPHIIVDGIDYKFCSFCGSFKSNDDFHKNKVAYDNRTSWCKTCVISNKSKRDKVDLKDKEIVRIPVESMELFKTALKEQFNTTLVRKHYFSMEKYAYYINKRLLDPNMEAFDGQLLEYINGEYYLTGGKHLIRVQPRWCTWKEEAISTEENNINIKLSIEEVKSK